MDSNVVLTISLVVNFAFLVYVLVLKLRISAFETLVANLEKDYNSATQKHLLYLTYVCNLTEKKAIEYKNAIYTIWTMARVEKLQQSYSELFVELKNKGVLTRDWDKIIIFKEKLRKYKAHDKEFKDELKRIAEL